MLSGAIFYGSMPNSDLEMDPSNSSLIYVFEIVRHGARAPIWGNSETAARFPVQPGMLTP